MQIPTRCAGISKLLPVFLGGMLAAGWPAVGAMADAAGSAAFYSIPKAEIAGPPGTLLRMQAVTAPPGAAAAYRIIYRSRSSAGKSVAVSGLVAIPDADKDTPERPIVSWGHGTTGIASDCAPSSSPAQGFSDLTGLDGLLAKDIVVVATDYQGLGEDGRTGYLAGASEGQALIDAARAVRRIPGAHASNRFATWGFSQGGHASLFAGAIARRYAPEMHLVGVAAVSAPTELLPLMKADIGTLGGDVIASYAAWSWSKTYHAPLGAILKSDARATVKRIAHTCSLNLADDISLGVDALAFQNEGFLKADAATQRDWQSLIARNSVPVLHVPVFLTQGQLDMFVRPATTRDYVRQLCRADRDVVYREIPLASHGGAAAASAAEAVAWLAGRFSDRSPPTTCTTSP